MTVLVTSADSPKALSVIRSLGRNGISVTAADHGSSSLGSFSRYCSGTFRYPSPKTSPDKYIEVLREYLRHNKHEVIIPVHSEDTYLIARCRSRLEPFVRIPLHTYDCINEVNDKERLMQVAGELGLPVPETYPVHQLEELNQIAGMVEYPVVIKVRHLSGSRGIVYAKTRVELLERYKQLVQSFHLGEQDYPIIQEYIEGDGYGVSLLYNQGDLRARCSHRRLREYPVSGGPSTLRESIVHPAMEQIAQTLLEHYKWHGLAMVEFKIRTDNKKPVLIEVNPRIWGSVNLAILAGVDFPFLLYKMAMDGDVTRVLQYRTGVQSRNCLADFIAMGSYLKTSGRIKNFRTTRISPLNDDIISADDPLPVLRFLYSGLHHLITK